MRKKSSFTLIELVVTIAIIMVIGAIVLMSVNETRKTSRDGKRISDLDEIRSALEMYKDRSGKYPITPENTYVLSDGTCEPTGCGSSLEYINTWSDLGTALQTDLSILPIDPLNGKAAPDNKKYAYKYKGEPSKFDLITTLEEDSDIAKNDGGDTPDKKTYEIFTRYEASELADGEEAVCSDPSMVADHVLISEVYVNPDTEHLVSSSYIAGSQWIEIYNPTAQPIPINNWEVETDYKQVIQGPNHETNLELGAGRFAFISPIGGQSNLIPKWSTEFGQADCCMFYCVQNRLIWHVDNAWKLTNNPLDINSDKVSLVSNSDTSIDSVDWGSEGSIEPPQIGDSIKRISLKCDTGTAVDFVNNADPTPGYFAYEASEYCPGYF